MTDADSPAELSVTYRLGTEADLPVVARMYANMDAFFRQLTYRFPEVENVGQAWVDSFRRTLGRFSVLWVAEQDGRLVGFVMGRIKRVAPYLGGVMVGELSDIWVEPDARRQRVADQLSHCLLDWMRAQGVHSVEVQVLEGNFPSLKLFERVGFEPELRQLRYTWKAPESDA